MSAYRAAEAFISAFDSLQWEPFRAALADDITIFFPFPQVPARVEGRGEVERLFGQFFEGQLERRTQTGGPISMGLTPRDWLVQMLSPDAAVVSFHLGTGAPARRSLVLRHVAGDTWEVVHWHASPAPPGPSSQAEVHEVPLAPAEMVRYEGTYAYESGGTPRQLRVFSEDDQMMAEVLGGPLVELHYQGDHAFLLRVGSTDIRIVFAMEGEQAEGLTIYQRGEVLQGRRTS